MVWNQIKSWLDGPPKLSPPKIAFPSGYNLTSPIHTIPAIPPIQTSGTDFGNSIMNLSAVQEREDKIYEQCALGNIPSWMRNFKPITVTKGSDTLTYFVSPDVLCIGIDDDYLRACLNGSTSRKVADLFGCILPTKIIADQIWQAADLKLMPTSMGANFDMVTTKTMISHNNIIQRQIDNRSFTLLTGHKKDVVFAKHLLSDRTRLAIYGWFVPDTGRAIQGPGVQASAHYVGYCDYSNSTRLVSKACLLNGQETNIVDVLKGTSSALISDEGPFDCSSIYL